MAYQIYPRKKEVSEEQAREALAITKRILSGIQVDRKISKHQLQALEATYPTLRDFDLETVQGEVRRDYLATRCIVRGLIGIRDRVNVVNLDSEAALV